MAKTSNRSARLAAIDLPSFGIATEEPLLEPDVYESRYQALLTYIRKNRVDAFLIYADREHAANLAWLTGFDPRFEEALLIVLPGQDPLLLTGPENQGVANAAPIPMNVCLYPPMGLLGQDRSETDDLADLLHRAGIERGNYVGISGWKYFGPQEHTQHETWIEIPSYIVDNLRGIVGSRGKVFNAGAAFMNPENGFRAINSIDELARFEFAACHTSDAVKRVIQNTRPGMQEYEAVQALHPIGKPLSCHTMFSCGPRAWHGLLSPSTRLINRGDAATVAYGVQGALNCRAGWIAQNEDDLPDEARDYVERLVAPYFEAVAEWLETIEIGIPGGKLDEIIRRRIGGSFFGVELNPGHLIHLDEWMNSPISKGSAIKMRSGMALQVDVIPATGGPYFTTNIEDGIALLDQAGRAALAEKYPQTAARIMHRRAFMEEQLGIRLKPDCLPFSNIPGWLPPFWLSPEKAMTLK
jgi:Xaa-Pro aminopeptidase